MSAKSSTSIDEGDPSSELATQRERLILVRRKEEFFDIREGGRSSDNFERPTADLTEHIDHQRVGQPEERDIPSPDSRECVKTTPRYAPV